MASPLKIPAVEFPDPRSGPEHGLLAVGGRFTPEILLTAYSQGIFPWPSDLLPHAWYSPDPRFVLFPEQLHVSRSLRKTLRRGHFRLSLDTAFHRVVTECAEAQRPEQDGTWISQELQEGFLRLHRLGYAHSAECWQDDELVGGVYGLALGGVFCGESMFARRPDASKAAFVHLVNHLVEQEVQFIDCQVHTEHLERFGAQEIPRSTFLDLLEKALEQPIKAGSWASGD